MMMSKSLACSHVRILACSHVRILACSLILGACAQASSPPGGEVDREPPRVVETVPTQGAIAPDFNSDVRIHFDETLSERGARAADVVAVSPEPTDLKVERHGHEIIVSTKAGWQKGRVYHVSVLPGLQDRFGNARPSTYDLVFSTGPAITATTLAGIVNDRLTGRPVASARVLATGDGDGVTYTAQTDTGGFFALRSLPTARYTLLAFVDQNRNKKPDAADPRDMRLNIPVTGRDTPVVEFSVLAPDSTPARLLKAEVRDSQQIRITFDDFIDAAAPLADVTVQLFHLPDSTLVPTTLLHVHEFEARQLAARDTSKARPPGVPPVPGARRDTARALPTQDLVVIPGTALQPRATYRVSVSHIINISVVHGGGGSVTFETPARAAPPRPTPADTTKRRQ